MGRTLIAQGGQVEAMKEMLAGACIHLGWAAAAADVNVASRRTPELNDFRLAGSRGLEERRDNALLYELELRTHGPAHER